MRKFFAKVKGFFGKVAVAVGASVAIAQNACAAITMPTLPTDDLELAITAVLGLVAIFVVGAVIARMLKKA